MPKETVTVAMLTAALDAAGGDPAQACREADRFTSCELWNAFCAQRGAVLMRFSKTLNAMPGMQAGAQVAALGVILKCMTTCAWGIGHIVGRNARVARSLVRGRADLPPILLIWNGFITAADLQGVIRDGVIDSAFRLVGEDIPYIGSFPAAVLTKAALKFQRTANPQDRLQIATDVTKQLARFCLDGTPAPLPSPEQLWQPVGEKLAFAITGDPGAAPSIRVLRLMLGFGSVAGSIREFGKAAKLYYEHLGGMSPRMPPPPPKPPKLPRVPARPRGARPRSVRETTAQRR